MVKVETNCRSDKDGWLKLGFDGKEASFINADQCMAVVFDGLNTSYSACSIETADALYKMLCHLLATAAAEFEDMGYESGDAAVLCLRAAFESLYGDGFEEGAQVEVRL